MFEFTVTRNNWLRGEGFNKSYLLRPSDGKMCCMGQMAKACGLPDGVIHNLCTLEDMPLTQAQSADVYRQLNFDPLELNSMESAIHTIYGINDDQYLTDEQREARLTEKLAAIGIKVTFVDE